MVNELSVLCLNNNGVLEFFRESGEKISTNFSKLCEYGVKFVFKDNNNQVPEKSKITFLNRIATKDSKTEKINGLRARKFELKSDGRLWFAFGLETNIFFDFNKEEEFVLKFLGDPHLSKDSVFFDLVCFSEKL